MRRVASRSGWRGGARTGSPARTSIAAGMVGLIEAADRYDDTRQEPFLAFAEHGSAVRPRRAAPRRHHAAPRAPARSQDRRGDQELEKDGERRDRPARRRRARRLGRRTTAAVSRSSSMSSCRRSTARSARWSRDDARARRAWRRHRQALRAGARRRSTARPARRHDPRPALHRGPDVPGDRRDAARSRRRACASCCGARSSACAHMPRRSRSLKEAA